MQSMSQGAPPLTTIQDTLYKADGTPFEGVLTVNWKSFEGPDASNVPTNNVSVQVVRGALLMRLVPTVTSSIPAYYSVRYFVNGAVQGMEYWSVPATENRLRVRDVRLTWPPDPTGGNSTGTIPIGSVDGLPEELSIRPQKGPNYTGSRAAVIASTGQLAGATGNATDCIRVDGSAGPCAVEGLTVELSNRPTKGPGILLRAPL